MREYAIKEIYFPKIDNKKAKVLLKLLKCNVFVTYCLLPS